MPRYASYATPRLDLGEAMWEYINSQDNYIGIKALPLRPVDKQAGTFARIKREGFLRNRDLRRGRGAGYNQDTFECTDQAYACEEFGLEGVLDDSDRAKYQSDFDAEEATVTIITEALLRGQEQRIAALLFNTNTWTGSDLYTDYSSTAPWTSTTTDVVAQIAAAKAKVFSKTGLEPRTLIINRTNLDRLANNDDLIARIMYTERAGHSAVASALADLLDLDQVLVGRAVYNAGPEGGTASISPVWSNLYAMVAVTAKTESLTEPCVGRTMLWAADSPTNVVVEQYRNEARRSDVFRVRHHVDELVFDPYYAHLLKVATS